MTRPKDWRPSGPPCTSAGCRNGQWGRFDLCSPCYVALDPLERFALNVDAEGVCWEWMGALNSGGYGQFKVDRVNYQSYRWLWIQLHGPLLTEQQLDHLCRNRRCVNPDHLEPVTQRENIRRGSAPAILTLRTGICKRGHDRNQPGVGRMEGGRLICVPCRRHNHRQSWARRGAVRNARKREATRAAREERAS